ncbi:hypothetical protein [Acinetobacter phage vB_AbaS_TCUP2199]|nr:hypothetical protein [Acinetobacter phage vB_AbaS_TCUP2199]
MSKREVAVVIVKAIILGTLRYLEDKSKDKKQPKNKIIFKDGVDEGIGLG